MASFEKIHKVNHSALNMFDLVADVEQYPEFVPMCSDLIIRSRRVRGNREQIIADMSVSYKFISETFTSDVRLDKNQLRVDVEYIDGPFRYLHNKWQFRDLNFDEAKPATSEIHFFIDYEFKSRALGLLMGSMFELVFSRFTKAFEQRADEVYGLSPDNS